MTTAIGTIPDDVRDLLERPLLVALATVREDPTGAFFVELAERYEAPFGTGTPPDSADRVIVVVRPAGFSTI